MDPMTIWMSRLVGGSIEQNRLRSGELGHSRCGLRSEVSVTPGAPWEMDLKTDNVPSLKLTWVVATQIFLIFTPNLGKWSNLTHIFQMGWNRPPTSKSLPLKMDKGPHKESLDLPTIGIIRGKPTRWLRFREGNVPKSYKLGLVYGDLYFPTCQVRVVRFYVSLFSSSASSSSSSSASSCVSLSSSCRDSVSSVWHAGPQLRSCEFSVACWTPTAILRVQCGVPDPNRDPACSVWRAGPQLWSCEFSAVCRTSTAIPRVWHAGPHLWWKGLVVVAERVCQRSSCKMSQDKSDRMSGDMFARRSERMCQKECQKICQKECQKICQEECQEICQKEWQKICQKDVRKNVRRYVRKNVRRYVRKNVRR